MRENNRITFVLESQEPTLDWETGEWLPAEAKEETKPCFVSDLGLDRSMAIFGDYKTDRKVVRLNHPYPKDFNYILYQGRRYQAINWRLDKRVFYIQADTIGGEANA